jgi:hypothetical protein
VVSVLPEDQERLFMEECRRYHRSLRNFHDPKGQVAISYAHELQSLWRRAQGTCWADGGVANGEMLDAVQVALGRRKRVLL